MERIRKVYFNRRILWDMSIRELKVKYSGARLGIWWAIITPLALAVSINFIFTNVFKINIPNYTLLVLSAIIPWIFFSNTLTEASNSFIVSSSILRQGVFPREFIPISTVIANFISFIIGFAFLVPLFLVFKPQVIAVLPFLFFTFFFHLIFIIGLGLIFALLNVYFRDLSHILPIVFMLWFWVTPVFYTLEMLPSNFHWVCWFNPMTYFITSYQDILFRGSLPSVSNFFISFLIAIVSFALGYQVFIRNEKILLKKI